MDWSRDAQVAPKKTTDPLGIGRFSIRLTFEPSSTKMQRESLLTAALRGLRGLVAAYVCEQLDLDPAILLATFGGGVGSHFLVLANADQVEAVCGNAILCGQVLNHGVGATLA